MSALPVERYAGIDEMLADARSRLQRLSPREAFEAVSWWGAVLVDIRPTLQRATEGDVDLPRGARIVERNVLEWRYDPRSEARLPEASYDLPVVVLCQEGYTSSLAAESLQRLGIRRAADVVGGFKAWQAAGLPVRRGFTVPVGEGSRWLSHPPRA